jgi:hypothetical protein
MPGQDHARSTITVVMNSGSKESTTGGKSKPKKGGRLIPMTPDDPDYMQPGETLVTFGKRPKQSKKQRPGNR